MHQPSAKLTLNKWLLLLLATLAFGISGYRQFQQQHWLAVMSVLLAWGVVVWLIQRHRQQDTAVLAADITSLQAQLRVDGEWLKLGDESWPRAAISKVEMGVIDQRRAYLYVTITADVTSPPQLRKFLIPYAEYQPIQQQLRDALPDATWLLP